MYFCGEGGAGHTKQCEVHYAPYRHLKDRGQAGGEQVQAGPYQVSHVSEQEACARKNALPEPCQADGGEADPTRHDRTTNRRRHACEQHRATRQTVSER